MATVTGAGEATWPDRIEWLLASAPEWWFGPTPDLAAAPRRPFLTVLDEADTGETPTVWAAEHEDVGREAVNGVDEPDYLA